MGRKRAAPDPRMEQAKALFEEGWKLVDIAKQYDINPGTLRRWKHEGKWGKRISERSEKISERSEKKIRKKKQTIEQDIEKVDESDLTEQQKLFCMYFIRCFNATKAYMKAYKCGYETAMVNGCRMLRNAKISSEIEALKKDRLGREFLTEEDIFDRYIDIAFSNITEFVEFGTEEVPVMTMYGPAMVEEEDGKKVPLMKTVNWMRFKDSNEVDGFLISEVKQGKDGASIKLLDKMMAMKWLTEHMDLATEEQKARIALLKKKAEGNIIDEDNTGVLILADVLPDEEDDDEFKQECDMETTAKADPNAAET